MQQVQPSALQKLISKTNRGHRTRPIPTQQAGIEPNEAKPLTDPEGKCPVKRIGLKAVPSVTIRPTYEQKRRIAELARRYENELPAVEIIEALFTIYSTEEIKAMAITEINNSEQFGPGSVNDPQMGPTDNSLCPTCSRDNVECLGHPGYIQLPEPMVHPLFWREVISVLNCVCNDCGGLLLTAEEIKERGFHKLTGPNRLAAIEKSSIGLPCRRQKEDKDRPCLQNPTYKPTKTKETKQISYEYTIEGEDISDYRTGQEVLDIFNNISDQDAETLGYANGAHPRRLIMEVLFVIPPNARPPSIEDGRYKPDPLTTMYMDIIRHAKILKNFIDGGKSGEEKRRKGDHKAKKETTIQDLRRNLFDRIYHFINNTDEWYLGDGKPFISLTQMIQTKEGLIRAGIMSKRVDYSSRTVLSPDPSLAFGQISVPLAFAPILTPKARVNRYNKKELQNLLEKGRITHITFDSSSPEGGLPGTRTQVTEIYRKSYQLQDGDIVERWLQDGDIVIFNRQPTLHKYAFMGYRAVLRDQKSFGLGLWYTTPHNAD